MDRERLLDSLRERISAFDRGEGDRVLAPEALDEADQLLARMGTPGGGVDVDVLRAVGVVHLVRWFLLQEQLPDEATASGVLAKLLLAPVHLVAPDAVPEVVAAEIRPHLSPPDAGQAGQAHDLGALLGLLAHATGHPSAFHDAIAALDAALVSSERTDPYRPRYLAALGTTLRSRYERLGGPAALTDAVSALTESVGTSRPDDPELPARTAELGFALRLDFERTGDPAALEKAVDAGRRAVELCPAGAPDRADILSFLAVSLSIGAVRAEPTLADEAIDVGRAAVALSEPDDPRRPARLINLALALQAHVIGTGDPADAREAVDLSREAIRATDSRDPGLPGMLSSLGFSLLLGDREDIDDATLDEAVSALERAAAGTPPGHVDHARCHLGLAMALRLRWERGEDPRMLDRCVESARTAVDAVPDDHPLLPTWLAFLASALAEQGTRPDAVDEAIEAYQRLLLHTPGGDPERATRLHAFVTLLQLRFELTADTSALAQALDSIRAALRCDSMDDEMRAVVQADEGAILTDLAASDVRVELSQEAETVLRDVARESTLEPAAQARVWHNLSALLRMRYERTGTGYDEAVDAGRQAVACGGAEQSERAQCLGHLAVLLSLTPDGLQEAERVGRQAVRECPRDHPGGR